MKPAERRRHLGLEIEQRRTSDQPAESNGHHPGDPIAGTLQQHDRRNGQEDERVPRQRHREQAPAGARTA
jgi:hypothetical protein